MKNIDQKQEGHEGRLEQEEKSKGGRVNLIRGKPKRGKESRSEAGAK